MFIKNLFKPKWRRKNRPLSLADITRISSPRKLRKIADQCDDERIRLEAARRLNDADLLKRLALSATRESVRVDAAIAVDDQPCLTAISLNTWEIQLGQKAVQHIHNRLLLRRVARSAQQDGIRLAAALKLANAALLRQVARSSPHIDVHWQVARYLDDPCMLAEIVMFKPANMRLEPLRRMARKALMAHLDNCRQNDDPQTLLTVIKAVANPTFKLEAFIRLPAGYIGKPEIEYMAAQDLRYIPGELLNDLLAAIQAGGWRLDESIQYAPCIYCRGKGELSLKCVSSNDTWSDRDVFACPDCKGLAKSPFRRVICTRPNDGKVELRLPA